MIIIKILIILYFVKRNHAQIECLETPQGINYLGKQNQSVQGACEFWSVALGNTNYKQDSQFPDITVANAKNYCRNPTPGSTVSYNPTPWCWLKNDSKAYANCQIPLCTTLGWCRNTYLGESYNGTISTSVTNKPCLNWNTINQITNKFPTWPVSGETIIQASNFCRNPDANVLGTWCYVNQSPLLLEPCMTALCQSTLNCVQGKVPYSFKSLTTNEQYMGTCASWSSIPILPYNDTNVVPSINTIATLNSIVNPYFNPALMPDMTLAEAQNYCRNPDNDTLGAWCYVQSGSTFIKKYCKTPCTGVWACLYDTVGAYYQGTVTTTQLNEACQRWDSQTSNSFTAANFPDGSVENAANYCRNPDGNLGGPWCYLSTTVGPPNFGYCTLPTCLQTPPIPPLQTSPNTSNCQSTILGIEYTGTISTTASGKTCQRWDQQTPQKNPYFNKPILFQTATMAENANYCRNPTRLLNGPWCYTTTAGTYYETCNLNKCVLGPTINCRLTLAGREYNGTINTTASGVPCLLWTSVVNLNYVNTDFSDGYIAGAVNYCRNPQKQDYVGLFCYTSIGRTPCVVPMCNTSTCRNTLEGYTYAGTQAVTKSGKPCLPWKPLVATIDPDMLPDASIDAASNYCRNPSKANAYDGPFCFSDQTTAETCGITYCTVQCRNTALGTDYAGIISRSSSNLQCRLWNDPSNINFSNPKTLNAATLDSASNYCRNPDSDPLGLWCYTFPGVKGYCSIPPCTPSGNCYTPNNAWAYTGTVNTTENNLPCLAWASYSTSIFPGPTYAPSLLPDVPATNAQNYCRAPTADSGYQAKPWCYLDMSALASNPNFNPTSSFGYCNVTICLTTTAPSTTVLTQNKKSVTLSPNTTISTMCYSPENVSSYNGFVNVTLSGTACLMWANMSMAQVIKAGGPIFNASFFAAESMTSANNYCRVPTNQPQYNGQPWCYVNPATATKAEAVAGFGFCSINLCNSTSNATNIIDSPAFNLFMTVTIAVTTFGLSNSAMSFMNNAISTTSNMLVIQGRPLPEKPLSAETMVVPSNNPLLSNAMQSGGIFTGGQSLPANAAASTVVIGGPKVVGYGSTESNYLGTYEAMIEPQQFQMNAANSEVQSAYNVVGFGSDVKNISNISNDILNISNGNMPKVVAEGYDEIYNFNAGSNIQSLTVPIITKENSNIIQSSPGPKIIGEGSNEQYIYNISGNIAQKSTTITNEAVDSSYMDNVPAFKVIGQGSVGLISGISEGYSIGGLDVGSGSNIISGVQGSGYQGGGWNYSDGQHAEGFRAGGQAFKNYNVAGYSSEGFGAGNQGAADQEDGGQSFGGHGFGSQGFEGQGFEGHGAGGQGSEGHGAEGQVVKGEGARVLHAGGQGAGGQGAGGQGAKGQVVGGGGESSYGGSIKIINQISPGNSEGNGTSNIFGAGGGYSRGSTLAGNNKKTKSVYYDINLNDMSGSEKGRKYEVSKSSSGDVHIITDENNSNQNTISVDLKNDQKVSEKISTTENYSDYYSSILDDWMPYQ